MKNLWKITAYIFLSLFSFIFFLYLTFPYEVLKETLVLKASETTGMTIRIGSLGPSFPIGVSADNISITESGRNIQLKHASANISMLSTLLGSIQLDLELEDNKRGILEASVSVGIFDLFKMHKSTILPNYFFVEARKFLFGQIIDFILNMQAKAPDANLLVKPLLEGIDIDGQMNADIDISIDSDDLSKSQGTATISLFNTILKSVDENIDIPDQVFTKALIKSSFKNGKLLVDKSSGFVSQDLSIGFGGKIIQKPQLIRSTIDFNIPISLSGPLKDSFGFILDAMANRETKGKVSLKISGSLVPTPSIEWL